MDEFKPVQKASVLAVFLTYKKFNRKSPEYIPGLFFHSESIFADAYFFSSTGFSGLCTGGAGGGGGGGEPLIPSLKLRMPSPNPFITSGMRRPPKKINTMAKTI